MSEALSGTIRTGTGSTGAGCSSIVTPGFILALLVSLS